MPCPPLIQPIPQLHTHIYPPALNIPTTPFHVIMTRIVYYRHRVSRSASILFKGHEKSSSNIINEIKSIIIQNDSHIFRVFYCYYIKTPLRSVELRSYYTRISDTLKIWSNIDWLHLLGTATGDFTTHSSASSCSS